MTDAMAFELVDSGSSKGEGLANEDIAGLGTETAWVIDGATDLDSHPGILPAATGALWIAEAVDDVLRGGVDGRSGPEIFSFIAARVGNQLAQYNYPPERIPPACSAGIVQLIGDKVEMAIVGDIFIYWVEGGQLLSDSSFARNEAAGVRRSESRKISDNSNRQSIGRRRLSYISGQSGSWILSNNVEVSKGARTVTVEPKGADSFLLCTDGFARLISYGIFSDWRALAEAAMREGIAELIARIREFEQTNSAGLENFKKRDDVCAIIVKRTPHNNPVGANV